MSGAVEGAQLVIHSPCEHENLDLITALMGRKKLGTVAYIYNASSQLVETEGTQGEVETGRALGLIDKAV